VGEKKDTAILIDVKSDPEWKSPESLLYLGGGYGVMRPRERKPPYPHVNFNRGIAYKSTRIKKRRKLTKKTRKNGIERPEFPYRALSQPLPSIRADSSLNIIVIGSNNKILIDGDFYDPSRYKISVGRSSTTLLQQAKMFLRYLSRMAKKILSIRFIKANNLVKLFCFFLLLFLLHLLGI